jgi:hypothetical protein
VAALRVFTGAAKEVTMYNAKLFQYLFMFRQVKKGSTMNLGHRSTADLLAHDRPVNVAGMATIVQDLVKHRSVTGRSTSELRERATASGLNEHEYVAILALCSKIEMEDSTFFDRFSTDGW